MLLKKVTTWATAVMLAVALGAAFGAAPAAAEVSPQQVSSQDCVGSGGVWVGNTSGNIQNGLLAASFCRSNLTGGMVKVHIEYRKDSGGAVTLRFAWQIVNSTVTDASFTGWDNGAFVQTAGTTRGHFWTYAPEFGPRVDASHKCWRGIMRDQNTLVYFVTGIICVP